MAGHVDNSGNTEYNQGLSLRRAQQVKGWLVEHGIPEQRIFIYAYGSCPNHIPVSSPLQPLPV